MKIAGLDDLIESLVAAGDAKTTGKVLRGAMRKGAKLVLADARQRCPVDTGALRASLKIRMKSKKDLVMAKVGAGEKDFVGKVFYAPMVEFGHFSGRASNKWGKPRKHVAAHPFLRPAFEATKGQAEAEIAKALRGHLEAMR